MRLHDLQCTILGLVLQIRTSLCLSVPGGDAVISPLINDGTRNSSPRKASQRICLDNSCIFYEHSVKGNHNAKTQSSALKRM